MDPDGRKIGELARDAGVNVETVRYYERRRLLKQPRRTAGGRRYDDEALRVLQFVKRVQELGFSLDEAQELLSLWSSQSDRTCARVRAAAYIKLRAVEEKIRDLDGIRRVLVDLTRSCPGDGVASTCPILNSLAKGMVAPMPDVLLLFDCACPNIHGARENLFRAFSAAELPPVWREVDLAAHDTPVQWKAFGSPTILVEGIDVAGGGRTDGATCRLYESAGKIARCPSVAQIVARLGAPRARSQRHEIDVVGHDDDHRSTDHQSLHNG